MRKPSNILLVLATAAAVVEVLLVIGSLTRAPEHDVPAWLHVTDADLACCTVEVQVFVIICILFFGTHSVVMALTRRIAAAIASGVALAVITPLVMLGWPTGLESRNRFIGAPFPGAPIDPVPFPTDFDYRAYLPHLLSAVIEPALWSLTAVVPLGVAVAAAARYWPRLAEVEQ